MHNRNALFRGDIVIRWEHERVFQVTRVREQISSLLTVIFSKCFRERPVDSYGVIRSLEKMSF